MAQHVPARSPVILVVDDEALLRMLAVEHFEEAGFEVIEAEDGASALAALKARPDVQMPGRPDGFALARLGRAASPTCAIVVVSGRPPPEGEELAPGARFVHKPYWGSEIVTIIKEMIARAE